jgi:hypothetical protein
MLGFFWSCDGSKRGLAGKQARSHCLSVISAQMPSAFVARENRFPLFSDHARAITPKNRGSGGAPRPKKETRPTGPGTSYIAAQYSQKMPKNNDKARATAPNRAAFLLARRVSGSFFSEKP